MRRYSTLFFPPTTIAGKLNNPQALEELTGARRISCRDSHFELSEIVHGVS